MAVRWYSVPVFNIAQATANRRSATERNARPFVLASTSIGQEALDFHPWCHRVVHWDLPTNPIDFEQREGRVHRYNGHAVRRNVVSKWKTEALASWEENTDVWTLMFELVDKEARELDLSEMVPCWVVDGDCKQSRPAGTAITLHSGRGSVSTI